MSQTVHSVAGATLITKRRSPVGSTEFNALRRRHGQAEDGQRRQQIGVIAGDLVAGGVVRLAAFKDRPVLDVVTEPGQVAEPEQRMPVAGRSVLEHVSRDLLGKRPRRSPA